MQKAASLIALVILPGVACSSGYRSPTAPTAPTATVSSEPAPAPARGMYIMVADNAFRPLRGARVEVLDGQNAGQVSIADEHGRADMAGPWLPSTHFRATMEGHHAVISTYTCSIPNCANGAAPWLSFNLTPEIPAVDIGGEYAFSVVADSACAAIPAELRTRTYRASAAPYFREGRVAGYELTVLDESMIGPFKSFPIGVAGNHLGFGLHGGHDPAIVERVGEATVSVSGGGRVDIAGSQPREIRVAMVGWIEYSAPSTALVHCESAQHQLILTRR